MPIPNFDEYSEKIERRIADKVIKPDDEPFGETNRDKLLAAGLGAMSGMVFSMAPILFKKKPRLRNIIEDTLKGGVIGITAPTIANMILKEKRGDIPSSTIDEEFEKRRELEQDVDKVIAAYPFDKKAGLLTTPLRLVSKAGQNVGGALWKGTLTNPFNKKLGIGERAWGLAVKGGMAYGGVKGISGIRNARQRSGTNYTSMIRNNTLAGNIKPGELSQADLLSIRQLGMK